MAAANARLCKPMNRTKLLLLEFSSGKVFCVVPDIPDLTFPKGLCLIAGVS
jgi:hypothetical protein